MNARQYAVWGGLALTLAACYWVSMNEAQTQPLVNVRQAQSRTPVAKEKQTALTQAGSVALSSHRNNQLILRPADTAPPVDLFAPLSVAVGSEAEIAAAQAPTMPNNPYSYAGKMSEAGVWTVFLTDGSTNFAVKAGDALQDGWHVKRIQDNAMVLVYQPMKYEVTLEFGASL